MAEPITMQKLIDASIDSDSLEVLVNGDENAQVTTRTGETYPSAKKAIKVMFENGGLPAAPFSTLVAMTAAINDFSEGSYAQVTDDGSKNGLYQKKGSNWVLSEYSPVKTAVKTAANAAAREVNKSLDYVSNSYLKKGEARDNDVLFAITDAEGNRTWLEANATDGGLTENAKHIVSSSINTHIKDVSGDLMLALADANGNLTELQIDGSGKVSDDVIAAWEGRMSGSIGMGANIPNDMPAIAGAPTSPEGDGHYYKNGELLPVHTDPTKVVYMGSSSAFKTRGKLLTLLKAENNNITMFNANRGGALIEHINILTGGYPIYIYVPSGVINATGDTLIDVDIGNNIGLSGQFLEEIAVNGWIKGVYGRIVRGEGFNYYFQRGSSGQSVSVGGKEVFYPDEGYQYRNAMQIIWIGKNNLMNNVPEVDNVNSLIAKTRAMINFNSSFFKKTVVITHFINKDEPVDSDVRARINYCNHLYKLHFKDCVFDVIPILTGPQIFTDLGITRTSADISEQQIGNTPPSLHQDANHLKEVVGDYLMGKLVQFIKNKNWV